MQLSPIELPDEDAVDYSAERDLLRGNIDVLPLSARTARIVSRHRSRRRHHVGMEQARVEGFFHGWPVRLSGQTQHATHGRRHELSTTPPGVRAIAPEGSHRNVNQPRIEPREQRA